MKALFLLLLLINCDQSIKNNNIGDKELQLLMLTVNNINIKNTNVSTVTNTPPSGTTGTASSGGNTTVVSAPTPVNYDGVNNAPSTPIVASIDLSILLKTKFKIGTTNTGFSSAYCDPYYTYEIGYKTATFESIKTLVKILNYTSANYSKVPSEWQNYINIFNANGVGKYFWISDRDFLYSNDGIYYAVQITCAYDYSLKRNVYSYSFFYADKGFDYIFNFRSERDMRSLCYKQL